MSQQAEVTQSRTSRPRWRIIVIVVLAVLAAGYVSLHVLVRLGWVEQRVRTELSRAAAVVTDGEYDIDFRTLRFSLSFRNAQLSHVALVSSGQADRPAAIHRATLDAFEIRGIHWLKTLFGQPTVDEVLVRAPSLDLSLDYIRSGADTVAPSASVPSGPPSRFPVEVASARLAGGSMTIRAATPDGVVATVLRDVSLEIAELDSNWAAGLGYMLAAGDVSLEVGSAQVAIDDSLHLLELERIRAASRDSTLAVGWLRFAPPMSDSAFAERLEFRQDRIDLALRRVAMRSVDFGAALRDGAIRAGRVVIDSFGIDVFSDHHLEPQPVSGPKQFLTEQIRDLATPIAIDTVVVMDGSISYAQRAADAERPGVIQFEDVAGAISGFSNDPNHTSAHLPMIARMSATLSGDVAITAEVEIPLLSRTTDMRFEASTGPATATAFNGITVPLEGIEFVSGQLDTLFLEGATTNGVSTGAIYTIYRDLSIRTVDKNTGIQNLGHALATLLADALFVRRENEPQGDRPPLLGEISYTRKDSDTFWGFLWYGLRNGVLSVVIRGG
jgi:hypothetical protein